MTKPFYSCLLGVAATLSCGGAVMPLAPPAGPPIRDELIVPGVRIGPIALGMSSAVLFETMGKPDESVRFSDSLGISYKGVALYLNVLDTTQQVFAVRTEDARYATKEGLRLGSTELEVRAKMGPPARHRLQSGQDGPYQNSLCYETGITFQFKPDGTAYVIIVHPRPETEGPMSRC